MRLAYLHLPRFPVQRRVLERPALAGAPLALCEDVRGQRRVAFASGAAQRAGVRAGMTATAAQALEPGLQVLELRRADEARALAALGEALLGLAPGFQRSTPDGLWLDAGGAHLCGGEAGLAVRLLEAAGALGWQGRVAVAEGAFTPRALARHGRARVAVVGAGPGEGAAALAGLPLAALEAGEEAGAVAAFAALGLTTLGEVAALPPRAVVARGGAGARAVQARCRGEDAGAFLPDVLEEVVEEGLVLEAPVESLEPLQFALKTALDRLCARLAGRKRAAVRLTLALGLDPTGEARVPLRLARPTAAARMLLELARHHLGALRLEAPVASLRVRVEEDCEDRGQQLVLGDGPQGDAALEVVLSRLATTLGEGALFSAALAAEHRPEAAYGAGAFRPPAPTRGVLEELVQEAAGDAAPDGAGAERPVRLLAAPAPLEAAELREDGALSAARLLGRRRRVTGFAGPERLGGAWWASAYARDYYRVHFEGLGPAWVFRDARDGRFYLQGLFD